MMKYAVILNGDLNAPHLKIYTNILEAKGISFDVISWDRGMNFERSEFTYSEPSDYSNSVAKKLFSYIKFSFFVKCLINKYRYDKLIVISPQVALFIPYFLKRKFKGRYIFDYRDLSIDQQFPFKPLMKVVLKNSFANVISSPGFKDYLPKGFDYILSHNFNIETVEAALSGKAQSLPSGNVKLLTIGAIRVDANYEVLDSLGNSNIELDFIGKGDAAPILKDYVIKKGYSNVLFKGLYKKEEEGDIFQKHTMVNIFYPKIPSHISALSNRFYNSLVYKRPMLVTKGGTQGYYVEKYGVGLAVKSCDNLEKEIKEYVNNLNFKLYEKRCNELLKTFVKDYDVFSQVVIDFINN